MESFLTLGLFLSIIVTTFNRGFFSLPALIMLISIVFIFVSFFLKKNDKATLTPINFVLVTVYTLFLFHGMGIYQTQVQASFLLSILPLIFYPLILTYLLANDKHKKRYTLVRFYLLICLAFILRMLMMIASPNPIIDVFTILKEAPLKILSLINPYSTTYSPVYPGVATDYYPYFPASFILELPFVFLFSDPRVLLILADIGSSILLYFMGNKTYTSEVLVLIYLFRPNSNFIIEQSWLTPLNFFLLLLAYFFWLKKKDLSTGFILAVLASVQPLFCLILPFFYFIVRNTKKLVVSFFITIVTIVAPFYLWDSTSFITKTIAVYFKDPTHLPTIPVYLSLNINTLIYSITSRDIPFFVSGSILICVYFWVLVMIRKRKKERVSFVILAQVIYFLFFYLLFRQSFINYYYFVTDLIILFLVFRWKSLSLS